MKRHCALTLIEFGEISLCLSPCFERFTLHGYGHSNYVLVSVPPLLATVIRGVSGCLAASRCCWRFPFSTTPPAAAGAEQMRGQCHRMR